MQCLTQLSNLTFLHKNVRFDNSVSEIDLIFFNWIEQIPIINDYSSIFNGNQL